MALTWKVKAKNLLVATCGEDFQHYREFTKAEKLNSYESKSDLFKRMKAVFIAAMDDYKGGYLTSIKILSKLMYLKASWSKLESCFQADINLQLL